MYFYNYQEKTDKLYYANYDITCEVFLFYTEQLKTDMIKINIQSYTLSNALS